MRPIDRPTPEDLDDARYRPAAAVEIGKTIQERREALGYNKQEAAYRARLSWHTWNAIEQGAGSTSIRNLAKAAAAFGTELFIELEDEQL